MTLRKEITKSRNEMYDDVEKASLSEDLERIVVRIDELEERINRIEINISMQEAPMPQTSERLEPFPGCNELVTEVIPVIRAAIAEKKRELAHKVVPMTESKH